MQHNKRSRMMQQDPMCCSQTNTVKKNENKIVVTIGEGEGGREKIGAGNKEVQTTMYKIIYESMYCATQGI